MKILPGEYNSVPEMVRVMADREFADRFDAVIAWKRAETAAELLRRLTVAGW